jgi:hypothetical protein
MYDSSGRFIKNIGRLGSGPGEFRSSGAIAVGLDGNVLMWDPGNARINVYTASGDVITSWPTHSGGTGAVEGSGLLTVDRAGTVYTKTMVIIRNPGKPIDTRTAWIRLQPNGMKRDTVIEPASPADNVLSAESRGQFASRMVPFAPNTHFELSPLGYFVAGVSDRIAIDVSEPGKPVVSIRRNLQPQPVTSRERDSARAEITTVMRQVLPSWSWNGADIPRTKPLFTSLTVASDGRFWLQLAEGPAVQSDTAGLGRGQMMIMEGRPGGPPRALPWSCPSNGWLLFDVYEPSGTYVGQVRVPERVDPLVMRGDHVWAVTCSADDVPSLGRYRITWP